MALRRAAFLAHLLALLHAAHGRHLVAAGLVHDALPPDDDGTAAVDASLAYLAATGAGAAWHAGFDAAAVPLPEDYTAVSHESLGTPATATTEMLSEARSITAASSVAAAAAAAAAANTAAAVPLPAQADAAAAAAAVSAAAADARAKRRAVAAALPGWGDTPAAPTAPAAPLPAAAAPAPPAPARGLPAHLLARAREREAAAAAHLARQRPTDVAAAGSSGGGGGGGLRTQIMRTRGSATRVVEVLLAQFVHAGKAAMLLQHLLPRLRAALGVTSMGDAEASAVIRDVATLLPAWLSLSELDIGTNVRINRALTLPYLREQLADALLGDTLPEHRPMKCD